MSIKFTLLTALVFISFSLFSQKSLRQPDCNVNNAKATNALVITPINNLSLIANYLSGPGVTISNVKFNGNDTAIIGEMIGYYEFSGLTPSFGIDTGIIISTGGVTGAIGPNNTGSMTAPTNTSVYFDSTLQSLIPNHTLTEAAVLEFDFTPLTDTLIACRFVFGSEEYPEFVNTQFNDVFGFFINGPNPLGGLFVNQNLALIPGTNMPITIDNVNDSVNSSYYINNLGGQNLQYDGYTTPFLLQQVVTPGQSYHFKVGVADAGDRAYDSGVFLKIKSFYGYASMPIANFSSIVNGNMVTFNNTTNWARYFVWDFGDGTTDSIFTNNTSVTHIYNGDGTYEVKLEAHNYYQVNTFIQTIQIGNTQGVTENKGNTFELIPSGNENAYQLNISLNQPQDVSVNISDITGKIVRKMFFKDQQEINHTIRLTGLAKGIYFMQIKTKENTFFKKVINK
ncbi:MAG: T9SS type A sorting domain-containing protein [Bacteroidetes bacterium]|nr:T9SS type A sorting domain-containing protein [Bacteroidota bacterium]